ncbi:MAG: hypothetical protein ACOZIN_08470 [Myxococcota bacterium]
MLAQAIELLGRAAFVTSGEDVQAGERLFSLAGGVFDEAKELGFSVAVEVGSAGASEASGGALPVLCERHGKALDADARPLGLCFFCALEVQTKQRREIEQLRRALGRRTDEADALAHEVARVSAMVATVERERNDARKERDAAKLLAERFLEAATVAGKAVSP